MSDTKGTKTSSSRKKSDVDSDSDFVSIVEVEKKKSEIKRKHIKLNSRKLGGQSGALRNLLGRASRHSKRPSSRKSHSRGIRNSEGFKGRLSVMRGVSFTPKHFPGFKQLARATSKVSQAFRDGWGDKNRNNDDKSSTSVQRMDPVTREAYEQMKLSGQPEDLAEAAVLMEIMTKFDKSHEVQHLGLTLMTGISSQEPLGLIENGILDLILKVFDSFQTIGKLLESACVMVWNLATENSAIKEIMAKNVDDKIVWVLSSYKNKDGPFKYIEKRNTKQQGSSVTLSPAAQLVYKAVGALKVLVINEDCKAKLVEQEVIPLMIQSFHFLAGDAPRDQYAQETCMACIQNFCNGPRLETYCEQVFKNSGHLLIIRSMLRLSDSLEIQLVGCAAIWNMCLEKETHRKKIKSLGKGAKILEVDLSETALDVEPKFDYPSLERRKQLAQIGAGTRAVAALKHFKEDNRVAARAMGALRALIMEDKDILEIVRRDVHRKNNLTKDLGLVNIFDVISDVVDFHGDSDATVEKFGTDLLITFEIEDDENTNREEIERIANNKVGMTLERLEKPDQTKTMKELSVPENLVLKPRANKLSKGKPGDTSIENLFSRKSLKDEFTGEPTPMVQRKDIDALKISDLVRPVHKKPQKATTMIEEKKPSVLMTPAPAKVNRVEKKEDDMDAAFVGMDISVISDGESTL